MAQPHRRNPPGAPQRLTDLFKQCGVDRFPNSADFQRTGDVTAAVDRGIGRVVLRLAGTVPCANALRLPRRQDDSLNAAGRFLYLQLRLEPGRTYALHADLATADRAAHRLSVSNLYAGQEGVRAKRSSGMQVFLPAAHDSWTLLALDLAALARQASRSPHARLRALQLCATMTVRGAFTSDVKFDWQSLPEDLQFTAAFNATQAQVLWVPEEPLQDVQVAQLRRHPTSPRPPLPLAAAGAPTRRKSAAKSLAGQPTTAVVEHEQLQPSPIARPQWVSACSAGRQGLLRWVPPDAAAGSAAMGSSSSSSGTGSSGNDAAEHEIVFAAGQLIVAMRPEGCQQRYLAGHGGAVHAMALSADGARLASAEEGPGKPLRLWDYRQGRCVATVPGHASGNACLDLSPNGSMLVSAGADSQGRQELAVWDVSACWAGGSQGREVARHASDYNIQAVAVVPWEPGRLVTCGKNSVRLYRLKDGQLRGVSVPMDGVQAARRPYSCGTLASPACSSAGEVFICMAFEPTPRGQPLQARRLCVGTLSGALYNINIEARAVEVVSQLHSGAVMALALHDGFCATGSADRLLRLWGSDLREAYMEAAHEAGVAGIAVSPDGLRVAVGTESGTLSLLDVASQQYTTLLRSHTAAVHAVAVMGQEAPCPAQQYCTAGEDGTVRVWDAASHQQLLELCAPDDTVLSIACHPSTAEVACGFRSGAVRIFDASSAALVQESRQHSGAVTQLAFVQHGRMLVSLGQDGCVCTYSPQRSYMPTAYLLAGFPLHATAMAASQDGKLLAVAALSMTGCGAGGKGSSRPHPRGARMAQPVVVLHNAVSMQPTLQLPVTGSSQVEQLQILPGGLHMLAVTTDRRLQGYSCIDGSLVLDVPRCLEGPCFTTALDPSGTFLVAGSSGGRLKVWGLHHLAAHASIQEQPAQAAADAEGTAATGTGCSRANAGVVSSLPQQELSVPSGGAVQGVAFAAGSSRLLTVGSLGDVWCWSFAGQPCSGCPAGSEPVAAVTGTLVVRKPASSTGPADAWPAAADSGRPAMRPVINLTVDCTAAAPAAPRAPACPPPMESGAGSSSLGQQMQWQVQPAAQQPLRQQLLQPFTGSPGSEVPAPRALPPVLQQHLPPRPPSAPAALPKRSATAPAAVAAASCRPQQSASLPTTPTRGRSKAAQPFWERQQEPEASLLVTAVAGRNRAAQVVRQRRTLRVTSPSRMPGASKRPGQGQQQPPRTAAWVESEAEEVRIPTYHADHQLQLLPPTAAVRHVHGFCAAAGFCWLPSSNDEQEEAQPGQQQLLYASGNVVVLDDLAAGQQRHIARLPRDICALAVSPDRCLAAAAVQPAAGEGSSAGIHLLNLQSGEALELLSHHSYAVTDLAFSHDGALLASISGEAQSGTWTLALWSASAVAGHAELVAATQLPGAAAALAWRRGPELPTFYTAGSQGLMRWQLEPEGLIAMAVHMPAALRKLALTAVACLEGQEGDDPATCYSRWIPQDRCTLLVGDASGRAWLLDVESGEDVQGCQLLAELPGQAVSCVQTAGALAAVGTAGGALLLLGTDGGCEKDDSWRLLCCEQLDCTVLRAQLDQSARAVSAATASGMLWRAAPGTPLEVLHCGQQHRMSSWQLAPGAAWNKAPAVAAVTSAGGVALWQLSGAGAEFRAPLVEFAQPAAATQASLSDDGSVCAAAHSDGSICLFDVAEARLRWRAAAAAEQGAVVALAVVQRLRGCKVLVAYRSGALYVLAGSSGQVAHRTMQFAVQQDSGRRCPSNFPISGLAVCPWDSAVFALCGQQDVVVCRAHWVKNAAVHAVARLSFGPADRLAVGANSGSSGASAGAALADGTPAAAAVQAVFSRTHADHVYCTDPTSPGQVLLLDYSSQAVIKQLLVPVAGGTATLTALALDPAERLLAAGTSTGALLLLRLDTEAWTELAAHGSGEAIRGLAFSACGGSLFSAAGTATFVWGIGAA